MTDLKAALTPEEQHKKDLERLEKMRPLDDDLMRELFRNNIPLAQFVLRIMTSKGDLVITSEISSNGYNVRSSSHISIKKES